MTQSTALSAALSAMNTNVDVGMNEVVSVFVSKYEDGLFAKKDELSAAIRSLKQELTDVSTSVRDLVDSSEYDAKVPNLGFTFKMGGVNVNWEKSWSTEANTYTISVEMHDSSAKRDGAVYTKTIVKPIPSKIIKQREEVKQALEEKNAELLEVMTLIKSVSRKERQIRGRISEMKLAESGFSGLLDNPEMLKLVEIK